MCFDIGNMTVPVDRAIGGTWHMQIAIGTILIFMCVCVCVCVFV